MKHRLVGTAVLVALGIIIWPVLFDTTPVREISQRSKIPEAPPVERFAISEPEAPQLPPQPDYSAERAASAEAGETSVMDTAASAVPLQPAEPVAQAPAPESEAAEPAPRDSEPEPALLDRHDLPVQWAVQLGVFGKLENAQDIKRRAEKSGYHAILQTVRDGSAIQYRVYVDPKLDKQAAQKLATEIAKNLGVKGYVTGYYP
ncbi:MAG: SPOR domain-containing protein [Gammaproteobacteria bacterium]|nr:SPOR domain-containing protein [Gammaproteobacteria bacterium]